MAAMDKVISIDGGEVQTPTPDEHLIKALEHLLAEARSGDLQSIIFAGQHHNELCSRGRAGTTRHYYSLYGAITAEANQFWTDNLGRVDDE